MAKRGSGGGLMIYGGSQPMMDRLMDWGPGGECELGLISRKTAPSSFNGRTGPSSMSSLLWMGKISRTWCNSGAYLSSIARYGRTNKHRLTHRQLEFGLQLSSASRRTKRTAVSWWYWCLVRQIHWRERAVELAMGTARNEKTGDGSEFQPGTCRLFRGLQSSCCTCVQGIYARRRFPAYHGPM
jgi:hypothetical protein